LVPFRLHSQDAAMPLCGSCIMSIMPMRLEKLRQVDLNLLITFAAIAEEKSVTAAASRLLLSQPAVSRALQRARTLFQDDLLVRSPTGFELTLRGRKILDELEGLLPKMERLVAPALIPEICGRARIRHPHRSRRRPRSMVAPATRGESAAGSHGMRPGFAF